MRRNITSVVSDDDLLVWLYRGQSQRLVLCFSGIGKQADQPPGIEFAETATGGGEDNVLYIADPHRTWLNGDGLLEKIVRCVLSIKVETGATEIVTLGHSMGGFAAMALAAPLGATSAVAFAPQVSVHPDIASDDPRWMNYRNNISRFRVPNVSAMLDAGPLYFVFHGLHGREAPQRERVPFRENIIHTILPKTHHNVSARLKNSGLLNRIVRAGFEWRRRLIRLSLKPLQAFHRTSRTHSVLPDSASLGAVLPGWNPNGSAILPQGTRA